MLSLFIILHFIDIFIRRIHFMPRMQILSTGAFQDFHQPPQLTVLERKAYLNFSTEIISRIKSFHTPTNQIGFLLNLGYFKISKRFYNPNSFHALDIAYITEYLGYEQHTFSYSDYAKKTQKNHSAIIMNLFNFKNFSHSYQSRINAEIKTMVQYYLKPQLIFYRCVDLMILDKINFPSYSCIQDLILKGISNYKKTLNDLIKKHLTLECQKSLNLLIDKKLGFPQFRLTLLKKLSQSIAPKKINSKLEDLVLFSKLYIHILPILQHLKLTGEGVRYFSTGVIKTKTSHLLRKKQSSIDLHVIAFIAHQYYCLQDNLVDVFLNSVKNTENAAKREHKDWCYHQRKAIKVLLTTQVNNMEAQFSNFLMNIRNIVNDSVLLDRQKLDDINKLVSYRENSLSSPLNFEQIKKDVTQNLEEDHRYFDILENRSIRLQNKVSGILKMLDFQAEGNVIGLKAAILNFITKEGVINKTAPLDFLSESEIKIVIKENKIRPSLYKVFLFQRVAKALKSGSINLSHSYKYRSLESYVIDSKRWSFDRENLLQRANMQNFLESQSVLKMLSKKLLAQFELTNENILSRHNVFIKIKKNSNFILSTPKQDNPLIDPHISFLPQRQFIPLSEVLATVNHKANFTSELQHWQQQHNRDKPTILLYASIMGLGMAIGTRKMARISAHISEDELENTVNGYLSLDNVRAANDCVINSMTELDLPKIYQRSLDKLHTASDGQKFEVTTDSLNSSHSFKYFGQGQGVSAYTFIDERSFIWHSMVFSAAERESAYVIDELMLGHDKQWNEKLL